MTRGRGSSETLGSQGLRRFAPTSRMSDWGQSPQQNGDTAMRKIVDVTRECAGPSGSPDSAR